MSALHCPVCGAEIKAAVSLNKVPEQRAERDVAICGRCASFLTVDAALTDVQEMTVDEIADLEDGARNAFIRLRREILAQRQPKREMETLRAICGDCGVVTIRFKYALVYIGRDRPPPCPKCGRALTPHPEDLEGFTAAAVEWVKKNA